MSTLSFSCRLLAVAAAAVLVTQAHAATGRSSSAPGTGTLGTVSEFIDVNVAGMQTFGAFGDPANTSIFRSITPGATVTGYDYLNLQLTTNGDSWLSEVVLSVNNSDGSAFLDANPSNTQNSGVFGPASGSWATALGGNEGGEFTVADGGLRITAYELFTDPGLNATVNAGTLRIYYTLVPEPATYGLMGLGLLGVAAAARRRRNA